MPQPATPPPIQPEQLDSKTRWTIYWLLIVCSVAAMSARLWQVQKISYDRAVPFLSANDRSRWCTIRALGDHDSYVIDFVLQSEGGRSWDTIDKVLHWGPDSRPHFYSSKPTLLPTLLTYPYIGIRSVTGWTLADNAFQVVRWMLLLCQVFPLVLLFCAMGSIADRVAKTDWARIYLMACVTFGTYVTTFAVTLNNHVPAVICVGLATLLLIRIWLRESGNWWTFFLTGLASGLAAAFELPAAAFVAMSLVLCLIRNPLKTISGFLPAVAIVGGAFFLTNYTAHHDWRPPYAHRSDGPVLETVPGSWSDQLDRGVMPETIALRVGQMRDDLPNQWQESVKIVPGGWPASSPDLRRWVLIFDSRHQPLVLADAGAEDNQVEIRTWNNWYEYPGSYWLHDNESKSVVDRGESQSWRYLANLTIWHHGVFSLTPIWFLSIAGGLALCVSREYRLRLLATGIVAISIVVIAFYVTRPIEDRNYGGLCCCPRWLLWLAPLWLVCMIPALDAMRTNRWWKLVALLLLGISIASACYAWANPWVHPWLYQWLGLP